MATSRGNEKAAFDPTPSLEPRCPLPASTPTSPVETVIDRIAWFCLFSQSSSAQRRAQCCNAQAHGVEEADADERIQCADAHADQHWGARAQPSNAHLCRQHTRNCHPRTPRIPACTHAQMRQAGRAEVRRGARSGACESRVCAISQQREGCEGESG